MEANISHVLGEESNLTVLIPGFHVRPTQQAMAQAVSRALANAKTLVVEAGTGTGKTLAYLAPAILSGKKVILSTGTKNLQDQLFYRDIPLLKKALPQPFKVSLLKGRANYLCHQRLERSLRDGRFTDLSTVRDLHILHDWSGHTQSGELSEINAIKEDAPVWPWVTSSKDNCLGQTCPNIDNCFLYHARKQAQIADLVIINHHLLFADIALRDTGLGEILPGADAIILDEAHQIPDVASHFFGLHISSRQLIDWLRDCALELKLSAVDYVSFQMQEAHFARVLTALQHIFKQKPEKDTQQTLLHNTMASYVLEELIQVIQVIEEIMYALAGQSKEIAQCWHRSVDLKKRLQEWLTTSREDYTYWYETRGTAFTLHTTPIDVASVFAEYWRKETRAWVFTSATLTVNQQFDHFVDRLGIKPDQELYLASPFDYTQQAILYIPKGLPNPNHEHYTRDFIKAAIPVLHASQGRAFILFTSHRALQQAASYLATAIDYPLLVQGSMPKHLLLEQFRQVENPVLLGTDSFWEGVDVRGDALSCVIIDRLPFASPSDPLTKARIDALKARGEDPFYSFQIPQAILALKQGIGRLIRDANDKGVLMIGDPRLVNRSYGRLFFKDLPPIPITRQITKVQQFFETMSCETEPS